MKTIDFSYFIERYNAGEMNEAEKIWFEKELSSNRNLRWEVELRKKTDKTLERPEVLQLRNKLAEISRKRSVSVPEAPASNKRNIMKYAAVLAGLILIGTLVATNKKPANPDELFEKYYTAYEVAAPARSQVVESNADYNRALEYYNVHDYRSAARYFSKVIENDPQNMESTMLYGVSNFESRNYPEAERSFKKVRAENSSLYLEDSEWYLALCYLKTGEQEKAIGQLETIGKSESIYSKNASKILRRLK